MNVLMLSLMYPEDMKTQVARDAKDKLQNQINSYQRAFVDMQCMSSDASTCPE